MRIVDTDNQVAALIPVLERLSRCLVSDHQERVCGACGCLLVPADSGCPNCRFKLLGGDGNG